MELGEFLELIGVGLLAGTWGSLIGAGGGFIMVPILLLIDNTLSAAVVTAVSLVAVFTNGVSGAAAYARQRRIDYRTGILFLAATLPGGVAGALVVNHIQKGSFQLIFGVLLILVSLYVFARPRRPTQARAVATGVPRRVQDAHGLKYEYSVNRMLGVPITFLVGFLAGMLGVGGGIFNVPSFVLILGIPIQVATATSQFMLVGTSFVANLTNIIEGDLSGQWPTAIALSIGTLVGGQVGARISQKFASVWLTRALSAALLVVGIRLLWSGATSV